MIMTITIILILFSPLQFWKWCNLKECFYATPTFCRFCSAEKNLFLLWLQSQSVSNGEIFVDKDPVQMDMANDDLLSLSIFCRFLTLHNMKLTPIIKYNFHPTIDLHFIAAILFFYLCALLGHIITIRRDIILLFYPKRSCSNFEKKKKEIVK